MSKTRKAGADAGNNSLKLCVKGQEPILIPSIYSIVPGLTPSFFEEADIAPSELEKNIDVTISSVALNEKRRYIIGEKVITDKLSGSEMESKSDKSTDELPVIMTLTGLAISAMKENPELDRIDANFDLSVALPVLTITPENAKHNAERFMGTHTVTFHHPSGRNVVVTIKIEYCKCLVEGGSGSWGIVYDEKGQVVKHKVELNDNIVDVDFVNKMFLSFDIGAGTTESVVSKGVVFNPRLSEGLHYGVKESILNVIKIWNRNNPRQTIDNITEFNEIYFNSEHPRHNRLRDAAENAFYQLANRLVTALLNKIDELKDDPYAFVYGGGAALLKDSMLKILKEKKRLTNVVFLKDPIFVNARGLLVYTCSARFEEMKLKQLGVV
ncbi:ParM/StbA family protein [Ectobacillus antri]|uniref:ParM/StbA family protein n=1 Tax=Ectobacillus antri TaxID=2486280 RepID=UPI000F592C5F|nr:ParM/StbA family protein [Ectobacillus antri]